MNPEIVIPNLNLILQFNTLGETEQFIAAVGKIKAEHIDIHTLCIPKNVKVLYKTAEWAELTGQNILKNKEDKVIKFET